jgi:hypothetical protein
MVYNEQGLKPCLFVVEIIGADDEVTEISKRRVAMSITPYIFDTPLIEGIIQKRKTQYTMSIEVSGEYIACHCPTSSRIGDIELADPSMSAVKSDRPRT